ASCSWSGSSDPRPTSPPGRLPRPPTHPGRRGVGLTLLLAYWVPQLPGTRIVDARSPPRRRPIAASLLTCILRPGAGVGAVARPDPAMAAVDRPAELAHERPTTGLVGAGPHRLVGCQVVDELEHGRAVETRLVRRL